MKHQAIRPHTCRCGWQGDSIEFHLRDSRHDPALYVFLRWSSFDESGFPIESVGPIEGLERAKEYQRKRAPQDVAAKTQLVKLEKP